MESRTHFPPAPVRRRRRIWPFLLVVPLVVLACCGGVGAGLMAFAWTRSSVDTVGEVDFDQRLAIPPLAPSRVDGQGRRVFDLESRAGHREFFPGARSTTWGVNGDYLGPTLRAARGESVLVNFRNALDEPTTLHWHGMHLPARMDGGPHQLVEPGDTWSPTWRVDQPAATLWYHPHPHGETEEHVYRGLAGMFLVGDPEAADLDLPARYGVDDVPVIVQDKQFDGGRLSRGDSWFSSTGRLGDTILVNGVRGPYLDVSTERVRLRLLNASTARVYNFGLADGRAFDQIGTDGGLLPSPYRTDRAQLSPGERAEIVVAMRPGERLVVRSYPPELGSGLVSDRFAGGDDSFDVLELRAAARLRPSPALPAKLASVPRLDRDDAVRTREFRFSSNSINGQKMDPDRVDAVVTRGTTEIWEVTNAGDRPHNFHIHDVQFQVLDIDGRPPLPHLRGWKDTIYATPNLTIRLIAQFSDLADPATPYMFHCHLLRHEDAGMMGQFVVVEPGGRPRLATRDTPGHDSGHHD
jgi:FtsP/CotA-like multicopper oxidase with cupredoxin domain